MRIANAYENCKRLRRNHMVKRENSKRTWELQRHMRIANGTLMFSNVCMKCDSKYLTSDVKCYKSSSLLEKCSGHFEFNTLLLSSSEFFKKPHIFCTRPSNRSYMRNKQIVLKNQIFALCKFSGTTTQATWFLQVPPRSTFKRLVLGITLWQHVKMTTLLKSLEGFKDLECKKWQLSSWPPNPCVSPTDLVITKESSNNLKVKLPDGTIFTMTIFSQGNSKEYHVQIIAVLLLINQKELILLYRKLAKQLDKLAGTLEYPSQVFWA
jgi:hypothetical protein